MKQFIVGGKVAATLYLKGYKMYMVVKDDKLRRSEEVLALANAKPTFDSSNFIRLEDKAIDSLEGVAIMLNEQNLFVYSDFDPTEALIDEGGTDYE